MAYLTPAQRALARTMDLPTCPSTHAADLEHTARALDALHAGDARTALIEASKIASPATQKDVMRQLGMQHT